MSTITSVWGWPPNSVLPMYADDRIRRNRSQSSGQRYHWGDHPAPRWQRIPDWGKSSQMYSSKEIDRKISKCKLGLRVIPNKPQLYPVQKAFHHAIIFPDRKDEQGHNHRLEPKTFTRVELPVEKSLGMARKDYGSSNSIEKSTFW